MTTETTTTDEANQNSAETVDVEIHYTKFVGDRDHEAFEITRDIRTYADPDDVTAETFDIACEVSLEDIVPGSRDNINTVLGHIYSRLQGGRVDEELGYDGSETRSSMIGDVIVVDDHAYLVGEGASFPHLGRVEYLHDEEPETDGEDGDDDLPAEGETVERRGVDRHGDPFTERAVVDAIADTGDFVNLRRAEGRPHPEQQLYSAEQWADSGWQAVEDDDEDGNDREVMTDGGVDELVIDDFDTAEALSWVVSRHARKVRDAMDMDEHAEDLFAISKRLNEELSGDRDDVSATFTGDDLDLLYEATEYTVEAGADGEITDDDVGIARRLYQKLGGGVEVDGDAFGEDVAEVA
jgi:hypothetical protein